jgi:hypothetical protein
MVTSCLAGGFERSIVFVTFYYIKSCTCDARQQEQGKGYRVAVTAVLRFSLQFNLL